MPHTGSCLCGAARFSFDHPVSETGACHCGMCRKWSGGIVLSVQVPGDALKVTAHDTIKIHTSSKWGERAFCGKCGSGLWYRLTAPGPQHGMHYINMGTLDDTDGITLTHELFIDAKPAGYALEGDHTRITGAEFFAMIEAETGPKYPE
ncbi:GFA family protein [Roseovarius dicentrarchi]|uniref:GFA family protein n=1 Tax=Roseovarius dicentrarchi TaxID=2250573 RepID=UPI000DE88742|nr:GFA family protein [Roseovarius dicentrarchi]